MRLTVGQDDTQNYKKAPEKQLFFRGQFYFATEGQPNLALGGQLRLPSGVKRARLFHKYSNLIISRTLSKFYGLPGLRFGFGFMGKGHDNFLSYANKYLGYNRFTEAVAIAALESDEHYRKVAEDMKWDRQLFKKELSSLPGFKVYKSVANFILIKYPTAIKERLQKALAERQYKIKFMGDKGLEDCLRITLGTREQIQVVVDTIKSIALG